MADYDWDFSDHELIDRRRAEKEARRLSLEEEGYKEVVLAQSSFMDPGTQDVSVLECLYCACYVGDKGKHRVRCRSF